MTRKKTFYCVKYIVFALAILNSCIKRPKNSEKNSVDLILTPNPLIIRAKELYLANDYKSYLNEIIFPATDKAWEVLDNFKKRHAKIPKTTWNKVTIISILRDVQQYESKIERKSKEFRSSFAKVNELFEDGLSQGESWSETISLANRIAGIQATDALTDAARQMKQGLNTTSLMDSSDSININALLPRVRALGQWIQIQNLSSKEMIDRIQAIQFKLRELKKIDSPSSIQIYGTFKETLCEFVLSSTRLAVSGLDKNSTLKNSSSRVNLCDTKKEDLSPLIGLKKAWIFPFWGKLTKLDFIEMVSTPVVLLGVNASHETNSDGIKGTQYSFFEHDVGHAHEILTHLFGDFEPSASSLTANSAALAAQTQLFEMAKRFTNEEKAGARETALRQFLIAALKPDLSATDRNLIVNAVFELTHEFPYMDCPQKTGFAKLFPSCSYQKTLEKSKIRPLLPATYLKRYLADGLELFAKPENEYWLTRVIQNTDTVSPFDEIKTKSQQLTIARSTLDALNKRVNEVLEW